MVTMNRLVFVGLTMAAAACGGDSKQNGDGGRIDARIGPDATPAPYCSPKAGTNLKLTPIVESGLELPVLVTAPAGDPRLFIVEQPGRIRIVKDGSLLEAPFLDVEAATASRPVEERLVNTGDEQGLLGLAFHPDYATNGRFFVHYTANTAGDPRSVVVSEFTAEPGADTARATEKVLMRIRHLRENHNGGMLQFGPDGYLYIAVGDGGGANHSEDGGPDEQRPDSKLGVILRIDVNSGDPYGIPSTNPWAEAGGAPEMFAWGLRNPWRFFIDHETNNMFIGDVGQGRYEEIDVVPNGTPGLNFGWPFCEGNRELVVEEDPDNGPPIVPPECDNSEHDTTAALIAYDQRGEGNPCSVVGGPTYRGTCIPDLVGHTFFGDVCTGSIQTFEYRTGQTPDVVDRSGDLGSQSRLSNNFSSFGVDGFGELYLTRLGRSDGPAAVFRVEVE
jgi:glucose/arabinose dehydrogenase